MKKVILSLLILTPVFAGYCQDRFMPAWYVTESTDTINGLIRYRDNYKKSFDFRTSSKSQTQSISIGEVASFGFSSGDIYRNVRFQIQAVEREVYAKLLIDGSVDLYKLKADLLIGSEAKTYFRLTKMKGTPEERLAIRQKNVGAFNLMFQGCKSVQEQAEQLVVSEGTVSGILKSYHECMNIDYTAHMPRNHGQSVLFGGFAGLMTSELTFDSGQPDLESTRYAPSSEPTLGLILLYQGKKPSSVFALQGELAFSKASFSGERYRESDVAGYLIRQTTTTSIEYTRLSFKGGFRLTGRSNVINPYMAAGLGLFKHLSTDATMHEVLQINDNVEIIEKDLDIQEALIGAWGSVGLRKKLTGDRAIFADVGYEFNSLQSSGSLTATQFRIGFVF